LKKDANHYGASVHIANLLVELGAGEKAAKFYENAIRLNKHRAAPHFGLMIAVHRYSKTDAAERHLKKVSMAEPQNFESLT
jgi:hypothetical protein